MSNTPESLNEDKFSALDEEVNGEVLGGRSASALGETHVVSKNEETGHYECDEHDDGEDTISIA